MGLKVELPQGASRWLDRLGRWTRRAADTLPPTWRGMAVAVLGSFALWRWGYGQMDLLLFVVSFSGLALFVLANLAVTSSAVYLTRRLKGKDDPDRQVPRLETGSPIPTGFSTPALAAVPLVKIEWSWVSPEGMDCRQRLRKGRLVEEVVAGRRALVQGIEREIRVRDAFGLCRVAWRRRSPAALQVLPHIGRLGNLPQVTSLSSAEGLPHPAGAPEGDRMDIRRYVPGDSVRHILWKTYARTRQLEVRIPERAVDPSKRTVAYLLSGDGDEPAAAAARVVLESGVLGPQWLFGADGTAEPTDDLPTALAAIARSGSWRPSTDRGDAPGNGRPRALRRSLRRTTHLDPVESLRAFLAHPQIRGEVHCVIFAAALPGPWVQAALSAAAGFGGAVSFVLGTDGVLAGDPPPFWHRLLFLDETEKALGHSPRTTSHELRQLIRTLESARRPVLVIDRHSGRSQGHLDPRAHGSFAAPTRRAG
jgi:hypothetical protein